MFVCLGLMLFFFCFFTVARCFSLLFYCLLFGRLHICNMLRFLLDTSHCQPRFDTLSFNVMSISQAIFTKRERIASWFFLAVRFFLEGC
ncbi:hypothetical protein BY458DRAFT_22478 [Sporodiniella umbellata]|nr:hypothetical protein BY458DRAFT_22478 [Sporodiniella umbellata]